MSEIQVGYGASSPPRGRPALGIGVHENLSMEEYVADPCPSPSLSASTMHDLVYRTPAHAWWNHPRLNPAYQPDRSARADLGSAVHAEILGGSRVVYTDRTDWRTKEARDFRASAWESGSIPILGQDRAVVEGAANSARALLGTLPGWTNEFETEGTMIWQNTGLWRRGRFDIWAPDINTCIDIKTCGSASPSAWIRTSLVPGGYDIQAEHYLSGLRALGRGNEQTQFLFLLVEIEPPFACAFVGLDTSFSEFARRKIQFAEDLWAKCIASDTWPGYTTAPHWAELPPWHEADLELRMAYSQEAMH